MGGPAFGSRRLLSRGNSGWHGIWDELSTALDRYGLLAMGAIVAASGLLVHVFADYIPIDTRIVPVRAQAELLRVHLDSVRWTELTAMLTAAASCGLQELTPHAPISDEGSAAGTIRED